MSESAIIPQFLFEGSIRQVHDLKGRDRAPYWQVQSDFEDQVREMINILQLLPKAGDVAIVWIPIEENIKWKHIKGIQTKLEHQIERLLKKTCDVIVELIPAQEPYTVEETAASLEMMIHRLSIQYPFETFGHVIGLGHPVISQALFLEGINYFGERYSSIFFDNDETVLVPTNVHSLPHSWMNHFKNFVMEYDYIGANELIKDLEPNPKVEIVQKLVQVMIHRMNFSFESCLKLLESLKEEIGERDLYMLTRSHFVNLLSRNKQNRDLARVDELFRQINCYLEVDDVTSFLVRFYRAREAVLFYLLEYAQTEPSPVRKKKNSSIYEVFEKLEEKYDCWEIDGYYGTYFWLRSSNVAKVLEERNKSFIGHSRSGINIERLWHSYYGVSTTVEKAKRRFKMDTSLMLRELGIKDDDTFDRMNKLIIDLMTIAEKRGSEAIRG